MGSKEIRKSGTMTGVVISLILIIALFIGMFQWWNSASLSAGRVIPGTYNDSYVSLTESQSEIDQNLDAIKANYQNITAPESGWVADLWNGLKGLGNTARLPISFLATSQNVYSAIEVSVGENIPRWAKVAAASIIVAFIIFLLLAILMGRHKM